MLTFFWRALNSNSTIRDQTMRRNLAMIVATWMIASLMAGCGSGRDRESFSGSPVQDGPADCDIAAIDFSNQTLDTMDGPLHFQNGVFEQFEIDEQTGKPFSDQPEWEYQIADSTLYSFGPAVIRVLSITKTHVQGTGTWGSGVIAWR